MSDSAERKIKLLLLYEILLKQTDELHPMTTSEIFTALQESGIAVSRQTLYEDIEVLNRYGFEVICLKGKENQYYISSRPFERPEAEILLQAVCSSDFLSKKKKYEWERRRHIVPYSGKCRKHFPLPQKSEDICRY